MNKTAAEFETWFFATSNAVSAAAMDPDAALDWVCKVDEPAMDFETLHERGSEESIDQKLLTALIKTAMASTQAKHTALMSRINKKARIMRADGKGQLRGRQCLFLIKRYFAVDNSEKITFELQCLISHAYDGDENLEGWKQHWDYLMEHQETPLTSKQAEKIYFITSAAQKC